jgi:hypothetical protein
LIGLALGKRRHAFIRIAQSRIFHAFLRHDTTDDVQGFDEKINGSG